VPGADRHDGQEHGSKLKKSAYADERQRVRQGLNGWTSTAVYPPSKRSGKIPALAPQDTADRLLKISSIPYPKVMDYVDAINEILDKAEAIKLPPHRLDVVSAARREFAKQGCCDAKFIAPIEETLRNCLRGWTLEQKREIWLSTEAGAQSDWAVEDYEESSIDMDLEGELMSHLIEELSPRKNRNDGEGDDQFDGTG
jgi:hypothetical protein